jgi:hypothetical protein
MSSPQSQNGTKSLAEKLQHDFKEDERKWNAVESDLVSQQEKEERKLEELKKAYATEEDSINNKVTLPHTLSLSLSLSLSFTLSLSLSHSLSHSLSLSLSITRSTI